MLLTGKICHDKNAEKSVATAKRIVTSEAIDKQAALVSTH